MQPYRVLVSLKFLQLERPPRRQREQILSFLERLAEDPFRPGDYQERDDAGRPVQIKIIGDYAITYWANHGDKEVKVTRIEKADRAP